MLYSNYYLQKNTEPDFEFVVWINSVEKKVLERFEFYLLDIPDEDYMWFYSNRYDPSQMVHIIQESNGFVSNEHKNKKRKTTS